jgi:hypothetical protein
MNDLQRLLSVPDNGRAMESIRLPQMPMVHRAAHKTDRPTQDTHERRNHCSEACRACGCARLGIQRERDSGAGEVGAVVGSAGTEETRVM